MMMQPNALPARLQRYPDLGIECVPEVRELPPVLRWHRQDLAVSLDATSRVINVLDDPYYYELAAIRGEDWMSSITSLDTIGVAAAAASFVRKGDKDRHGNPVTTDGFTMLIVYARKYRSMYDAPWRPGVITQPSCGSLTGLEGKGNPGGPCKACAYNRFGTAVLTNSDGEVWNGAGKKCGERLWLFGFEFATHGEDFDPTQGVRPHPIVVDLPWQSRETGRLYLEELAKAGSFQPWEVITEVSLATGGGQAKAAHFTPIGLLDSSDPALVQVISDLTDSFRGMALDWLNAFERRSMEQHGGYMYDVDGGIVMEGE